ncbi:MAG: hypothetical protein LBD75_06210 [Candidatus Peribacteria bacterium]|jgi:hypothetical protein|nr:hypothetical protein [Candidatus Peribacteria bacterium]
MRFLRKGIVLLITSIAYCVCTISLFTTNAFIVPLVSFIFLFIGIYFLAIECYRSKIRLVGGVLSSLVIIELLLFAEETWHSYLEILLFHLAVALMIMFLFSQLKTRIHFSALSYFTEGGYSIAAILTLFFSVLMLGKYSQIPFNCNDIDNFPQQMFQTPVEQITTNFHKVKNWRTNTKELIGLQPASSSLAPPTSIITPQKTEVELFFERSKAFLTTQALELQSSITKNSCEFVMQKLQATQKSDELQLVVLLLMYFLLIGIFKLLLRIVSFIGLFIFLLLKPFKWYHYEKGTTEKESIT